MSQSLYLLAILMTVASAAYVNDWDQPFNFRCPDGQVVSYVSSVHDNRREDRRWEFLCRTARQTHSCTDSGYVNDFDGPLVYTCPGNKVMVGVHSYHNNRREDRRFGFYCCDVQGSTPRDCYTTDYVNDWDGKLTLAVPEGRAVKAAFSHHNNRREDRRWQFQICAL
ncbi:strain EAF dermatopontin 3 [Biomphalaria glabrata]|uniref:Dermatopontin 3 n=1 Tax=Biomphalaria glabrata TaxID=6526 RepID=Q3YJU8_BIOGL|nr:dermatopontin 3 [Biomphalaria glabrata]KAI8734415.1 strain EAF dermatopontin 3 dermatopontin 3 [Biomphalaria glabrata]